MTSFEIVWLVWSRIYWYFHLSRFAFVSEIVWLFVAASLAQPIIRRLRLIWSAWVFASVWLITWYGPGFAYKVVTSLICTCGWPSLTSYLVWSGILLRRSTLICSAWVFELVWLVTWCDPGFVCGIDQFDRHSWKTSLTSYLVWSRILSVGQHWFDQDGYLN